VTRIIGLLGPAGSGKSTCAEHLVTFFGALRYSLATPLKEFVQRSFNLSHDQLYGTQEQKATIDPRYNVSPRWLLQRIGTEGGRSLGELFWVKQCLNQILADAPALAVIDDVRFVDESLAIRANQGTIIRLHPPRQHVGLETPELVADHVSEQEWRRVEADFEIIPNQRSIFELNYQINQICKTLQIYAKDT
jgi:hypothetical protein